ncbi:cytochrome P450, putative [Ricinus communis]|uniref:Cytochrome P450, putative n=1 Tax=Ricinus communis TaxID=3988 RepID=B9SPD0_RICCO|nr:cytochrome P450, putative [Ricinus communis]
MWTIILFLAALLVIYYTIWINKWGNPECEGVLPPDSMGIPIIGETLQLFIPSNSLDIHTIHQEENAEVWTHISKQCGRSTCCDINRSRTQPLHPNSRRKNSSTLIFTGRYFKSDRVQKASGKNCFQSTDGKYGDRNSAFMICPRTNCRTETRCFQSKIPG